MEHVNGYQTLLDSVINDIEKEIKRRKEGNFTFNRACSEYDSCREKLTAYAENGPACERTCEFCEKFKYAIDRAKEYGEKLNIPWEEIIASWEEDRSYWYMNYYQESNQPPIGDKKTFVFESIEDMRSKIGDKFICPACKKVGNNPYECSCGWTSYGLFQTDLAFLYCKKERKSTKCFMPQKFSL